MKTFLLGLTFLLSASSYADSIEVPKWGKINADVMKINDDTVQKWIGSDKNRLSDTGITFSKDINLQSNETKQSKHSYITFNGSLYISNGIIINSDRKVSNPSTEINQLKRIIPNSIDGRKLAYPFQPYCEIKATYADSIKETSKSVASANDQKKITQIKAFRYIDKESNRVITVFEGYIETNDGEDLNLSCYFPLESQSYGNGLREMVQEVFGSIARIDLKKF